MFVVRDEGEAIWRVDRYDCHCNLWIVQAGLTDSHLPQTNRLVPMSIEGDVACPLHVSRGHECQITNITAQQPRANTCKSRGSDATC